MKRRDFLKQMGLGAMALSCAGRAAAAAVADRPNIIVIMCDDMGWSDIGCYGGEIETPNLDALAARGVRFTQFYNTARCCPSRASLLTGLYAHQAGMGSMVGDRPDRKGYEGFLTDRCVTVAEVLKDAGYQTCLSGKWHVSPMDAAKNKPLRPDTWPLQRGFDKFFGTIAGAGSFYFPKGLMRGNELIEVEDPDRFYYTDAISDHAVDYIRECTGDDAPYFLYVGYTAPHWPMHALPKDIKKYEDRYREGWDALREERHARQLAMGLVEEAWPLSPRDDRAPAWEEAEDKEWQIRRMAVYAAMIDSMDQGIGRIMVEVERTGTTENTLIMFISDNGGCAEEIGAKGGSCKVAQDRGIARGYAMKAGNRPDVMPGAKETFQSYGLPWANASNTPFRLYKKWGHEGGIATPFILAWPRIFKDGGKVVSDLGHIIDLMPTCLDAAGATAPATYKGHAVLPPEGKSLLPILKTGSRKGHDFIAWEHNGNRAIRQGKWKLVAENRGPWELYDMEADRTELTNLIEAMPEKARELESLWYAWADRTWVAYKQ